MVRAGDIIAQRLGAPAAQEGGAGMADLAEQCGGFGRHDLQMFGSEAVGQRHRLIPVAHQHHRAMRGPTGRGNGPARQGQKGGLNSRGDGGGEACIIGDEDALRRLVMLGLGQQIHRDMGGVVIGIGQHHHLGRAGDAVDAHAAKDLALGLGDIGIAGADNTVHRGDALGAPGHGGYCLGAADAEHLGHARALGCGQH